MQCVKDMALSLQWVTAVAQIWTLAWELLKAMGIANPPPKKKPKRCFTSYVVTEMQNKTTMRYHHISMRMAQMWKKDNTKCLPEYTAIGTFFHYYWECKIAQTLLKSVWCFLTKLNILLPYDGIYSKEVKIYVSQKPAHMLTAFFSTLPKCRTIKMPFSKCMDK